MLKNNSLKVLSVLIAIFMWIIVVSGQVETTSMTVPVKLVKTPAGYVAVSDIQNVSVVVKGPARVISNLDYTSVAININVESVPVGTSRRRMLPSDFSAPRGVEVEDVTPQELDITIDRVASKQVKIMPTFIGDVAKGFVVESVMPKPNFVVIEGAKSKLKKIDSISTVPINISNLDNSSKFTIGFKSEDGIKTITPNQVEVTVTTRQVVSKKVFNNIPVSCTGLRAGLTLKGSPKLAKVTVSGRDDLVASFIQSTHFLVNCSAITKEGKFSGAVTYDTPVTGVEVEGMSPQRINFEIGKL